MNDLAEALLRAEQAHGQYQAQIGREVPDWPTWYAQYFERELTGGESAPAGQAGHGPHAP